MKTHVRSFLLRQIAQSSLARKKKNYLIPSCETHLCSRIAGNAFFLSCSLMRASMSPIIFFSPLKGTASCSFCACVSVQRCNAINSLRVLKIDVDHGAEERRLLEAKRGKQQNTFTTNLLNSSLHPLEIKQLFCNSHTLCLPKWRLQPNHNTLLLFWQQYIRLFNARKRIG